MKGSIVALACSTRLQSVSVSIHLSRAELDLQQASTVTCLHLHFKTSPQAYQQHRNYFRKANVTHRYYHFAVAIYLRERLIQ